MSRILLVGKGPPDGGGISSFLQSMLASDLRERHEVGFLNLSHAGSPRSGRLTGGNVTRTLRDARRVWRAASGVDIVHIHSAVVPLVTLVRVTALALPARLRGARVVVHAHSGKIPHWLTGGRRRLLGRLALAPVDSLVAVSEGSRAALAAVVGQRRVSFVRNGVSLGRREERPEPGHPALVATDGSIPRILFAGVITARKGAVDLLAASETLRARGVAHELLLAGGTPDEGPDAEAEVRRHLHPAARLLGPVPHEGMGALYAGCDVFCLPSWWEGMPLSVLEAMASGLPVVATDVGDISEAVEDGVTGLLVPARDPAALADALERVLTDEALRARLGRAGREAVAHGFGFGATVAGIEAVYRRLAA